MNAPATAVTAPSLLASFTHSNDVLGGQPAYRRVQVAAARAFLADHPDLDAWMAAPVEARLVELQRRPLAWLVFLRFFSRRLYSAAISALTFSGCSAVNCTRSSSAWASSMVKSGLISSCKRNSHSYAFAG